MENVKKTHCNREFVIFNNQNYTRQKKCKKKKPLNLQFLCSFYRSIKWHSGHETDRLSMSRNNAL